MNVFVILLRNIRPYRSLHYGGLVLGGALIASWVTGTPFSLASPLVLAGAIIFAFQTACVVNDFYDREGDRISNPERPLSNRTLSPHFYRRWGLLCLAISLLFSAGIGWVPFAFICLFHILYTVYSVPPFRLKRFFPVNTAIVACNGLIAMLAGFSIIAAKQTIILFPLRVAVVVMVSFLASINMIHIKDREADFKEGIRTIPTMFKEQHARKLIAALTVIAYFNVPVVLGIKALLYPSLIGAGLGIFWVLRRNWQEGPYFITYFAYYVVMLYFLRIDILGGGS